MTTKMNQKQMIAQIKKLEAVYTKFLMNGCENVKCRECPFSLKEEITVGEFSTRCGSAGFMHLMRQMKNLQD